MTLGDAGLETEMETENCCPPSRIPFFVALFSPARLKVQRVADFRAVVTRPRFPLQAWSRDRNRQSRTFGPSNWVL